MVGSSASLKSVAARKFLGKLRYIFAGVGPGGKVGGVRDNAVGFPNRLVRKIPGIARLGSAGKVRCLVHGIQQEECAALAAVSELTQRTHRRTHLVRFEQEDGAGEQVPGGVLECISPDLFLELVSQGKKAVLVFQASEGEQHGACGSGSLPP